jgi:hypothetical protein
LKKHHQAKMLCFDKKLSFFLETKGVKGCKKETPKSLGMSFYFGNRHEK